jgi:hypothetical protein
VFSKKYLIFKITRLKLPITILSTELVKNWFKLFGELCQGKPANLPAFFANPRRGAHSYASCSCTHDRSASRQLTLLKFTADRYRQLCFKFISKILHMFCAIMSSNIYLVSLWADRPTPSRTFLFGICSAFRLLPVRIAVTAHAQYSYLKLLFGQIVQLHLEPSYWACAVHFGYRACAISLP